VIVSVVHVGPMGVAVRQRLVLVQVLVPTRRARESLVVVVVMTIVVAVPMGVHHRFVLVFVLVV